MYAACRIHDDLVQCCQALNDVLHNSTDKKDAMSLETAHNLMKVWTVCHESAEKNLPFAKLCHPMNEFKACFFEKMQQGFCDKNIAIMNDIISSINHVIKDAPTTNTTSWRTFRSNIDDYLRLSTAEVFSSDDRAQMTRFGEAADIFYSAIFHCQLA